jgi:hypothetical protein
LGLHSAEPGVGVRRRLARGLDVVTQGLAARADDFGQEPNQGDAYGQRDDAEVDDFKQARSGLNRQVEGLGDGLHQGRVPVDILVVLLFLLLLPGLSGRSVALAGSSLPCGGRCCDCRRLFLRDCASRGDGYAGNQCAK